MAIGAKHIETRSWAAPRHLIGKELAIHATAKWDRETLHCIAFDNGCWESIRRAIGRAGYKAIGELPLGSVVAVVRLTSCERTEHLRTRDLQGEQDFGDFTPWRYGWVTELVERIEPAIPARGAQGIWAWERPEAAP
jgi:hypothetical protein